MARQLKRELSLRGSLIVVVIDQTAKKEDLRLSETADALLDVIEEDPGEQRRVLAIQGGIKSTSATNLPQQRTHPHTRDSEGGAATAKPLQQKVPVPILSGRVFCFSLPQLPAGAMARVRLYCIQRACNAMACASTVS
jgi:hypothetical protein